jgi:alpha-beta hydrolase superfamily lysophospholipase
MCIPSYQSLLDDIGYVLAEVADQHGNVPLGLIGQSMGGNLVLNYALRKMPHADFVVASSPMLRSPGAPGPIAEFFARGILAIMPDFYLAAPVRVERLAKNEQVQKRFIEDNLVQHKVSLRLGAALIDSGKWALQNASRLAMPALVIHGDKDEITSPTASEEFVLGAKDWAELKIWPNGLHDLHLDDERESYMQFMWDWIRRQMVC